MVRWQQTETVAVLPGKRKHTPLPLTSWRVAGPTTLPCVAVHELVAARECRKNGLARPRRVMREEHTLRLYLALSGAIRSFHAASLTHIYTYT